MLLNNKEEYKQWVLSHGQYLRKWPTLTKEQKWFVYANARSGGAVKVATITAPTSKMVWSCSKKKV